MARLHGSGAAPGRRFAVVGQPVQRGDHVEACRRRAGLPREHGVRLDDIDVVSVPGAWELPVAAERLLASDRYDGIVAVGAVIRGETPHFDYVAGEASRRARRPAARVRRAGRFRPAHLPTPTDRPRRVPAARTATRDMTRRSPPSRWSTSSPAWITPTTTRRTMARVEIARPRAGAAGALRVGPPRERGSAPRFGTHLGRPRGRGRRAPARDDAARASWSPTAPRSTPSSRTSRRTGGSNGSGRSSAASCGSRAAELHAGVTPPRVVIQDRCGSPNGSAASRARAS